MSNAFALHDLEERADRAAFRRAVLDGLSGRPRAIPARFLYDAQGSRLFDRICELPEYYVTRTETAILRGCAPEIAGLAGPRCALVEFGSGSSVKSRLLLDALPDLAAYAPIDISRRHLEATAHGLRRDYPGLPVAPLCADYMTLDAAPPLPGEPARLLGFFPGSTIGNLEPWEARLFLRRARTLLGDDGALVVGVDLRKDPQRLHDAYNDAQGVTAAFTLNLLRRMNRELEGGFDLSRFAHDASWNAEQSRIEIYFRSLEAQTVSVAGFRFGFAKGERVHTEYSYKYGVEDFAALATSGGFEMLRLWTDPERLFAVCYLAAADERGGASYRAG